MPSKPNIVFFFTDDQRFNTIHALGNDEIITPNIDRLVANGVAFTHAHIPCGTSGAVCMPSRAMLNTGRSLFHIEGAGQSIPDDHTTIGEALQGAGYRTFGTGKWHNGARAYARSFTDGDEIFFGGMADHWNVPAFHYDPTGQYKGSLPWIENWQTKRDVKYRHADHINCGKHSSEMVVDAALSFIETYDSDAPFYTYISFLAPHDPRSMPKQYLEMYDPATISLPKNFMGGHPFDTGALHIRDEQLAGFPRTPKETRQHIAEYYAMITHLDAQLGRVLAGLEAKGILDDTILVFAGDNGLALGQHGLFGKQNCYEHSVRVPLVIAGPGVPKGERSTAYAYLFDIFPTLCELTGTRRPASVEGTSLVPAFTDGSCGVRDTLYFAYTDSQRAVKDRQFKLIEYVAGGEHIMTQLFDFVADPWELSNLADDPAYAGKLAELRTEMFRLRDEWDDRQSEWGERFWAGYGNEG
ncbi:MAG: sulfatase-like hydrolase/transferase [Victivallales bacterium]|nr:sulfatase-like hydrolase/transferase [Victivallales bacterium]